MAHKRLSKGRLSWRPAGSSDSAAPTPAADQARRGSGVRKPGAGQLTYVAKTGARALIVDSLRPGSFAFGPAPVQIGVLR